MSQFLAKCREFVASGLGRRTGADPPVVRAAFDIRYALQLSADALPVSRQFLVLQTADGYGSCHFETSRAFHARCLNVATFDVDSVTFPREYRIAALDAAAARIKPATDETYTIAGSTFEKVGQRSALIASEVAELLGGAGGRVLLVGALGNVISHLMKIPRTSLIATDHDAAVIGRRINGVDIASGGETLSNLKNVDVAS